jgi:Cof subfamily protein (haloacid dehalogenase superfamily)
VGESPGYRLLVTDIDGTLVPESKAVPPGVAAAVRAAQARGVRVCLATGRMWEAARPFAEAVGADPPAILYNGALVYDFAAGRTLWSVRLPLETARRVLPVIRSFPQVSPQLYVHGRVYAERMTPHVELYARRERLAVEIAPAFDGLLNEDPVKILVVGARPDLEALSRALAALPGTPVNQVFSQQDYLEILPADVSKGVALPVLARAVGVPLEQVVAVGDNLNDLAMVQAAGMGVAVEGSPPELLAAADWVCPPPEREGLRVLIERLFLREGGGRGGGA